MRNHLRRVYSSIQCKRALISYFPGCSLLLVLTSLLSPTLFAIVSPDQEAILQRIRPLGVVHVDEQQENRVSAASQAAVESKSVLRTGEAVYRQYCHVCHESGVAGAPKFRNQAEWQSREKAAGNIDGLLSVSIKGLNAMPPKGTCSDCTDEELKQAIQYMLPK